MKWIKNCINKIIHHNKRYEPLSLNHDGTTIDGRQWKGQKNLIKKIFTPVESEKKIKENFKYAPAWVRSIIYEILGLKR